MFFFRGVAVKIAVSSKLMYNFGALAPIPWSVSKDVLKELALDFALLY